MKVGDLVRYRKKPNSLFPDPQKKRKIYVVTFVFPSGNVRLHPWPDDEAHNVNRLEVVSCK